ncbi:hypothetical protein [Nitrospira sp. Nam80]
MEDEANITAGETFLKLFRTFLSEIEDMCAPVERWKEVRPIIEKLREIGRAPQKTEEQKQKEAKRISDLKTIITSAASYLPGSYRENYSDQILKTLESVQEWSPGTVETLSGAVFDLMNPECSDDIKSVLALTSNVYRSFLEPELVPSASFPQPDSRWPALVTFNPEPKLPPKDGKWTNEHVFVPFTLPTDEVYRLCGARVAVVSLPSVYRCHPVLCWAPVAHEAGGHDVLHAYKGLLPELQRGVRELFYRGPDPHVQQLDSDKQKLGLLWQYWTEETASDVYAVMNLGPSYGIALALYFAALGERVRRHLYGKSKNGNSETGDRLPALSISNIYDEQRQQTYIKYHPPNILALYAVIGAIEALNDLPDKTKDEYIRWIKNSIDVCLAEGNEALQRSYPGVPLDHYATKNVLIKGWLQIRAGTWIWIGPKLPIGPPEYKQFTAGNALELPRPEMQEYARQVGYYIASSKLKALGGHSIQDLETWDECDENQAEHVSHVIGLINPLNPDEVTTLSYLGDDAQLLAGAILALAKQPSSETTYVQINRNLGAVLKRGFDDDEVWGTPVWHPITS